jgi:hypothetical protein
LAPYQLLMGTTVACNSCLNFVYILDFIVIHHFSVLSIRDSYINYVYSFLLCCQHLSDLLPFIYLSLKMFGPSKFCTCQL